MSYVCIMKRFHQWPRLFLLGLPMLLSLIFINTLQLLAQDAYHTALQQSLSDDYELPAGEWISYNTEVANLDAATYYGDIELNTMTISGQDFSRRVKIEVKSGGGDPWTSAWSIRNPKPITKGHRLLWVIWLRSSGNPEGKVNLFAEDVVSFEKEVIYTLPLAQEWKRYLIPFEARDNYPTGDLNFGLHLGIQSQTIELGGWAIIDYGTSVDLQDLPQEVNNDRYGGYETDAPWRAAAANRIDSLRKADLQIQVRTPEDTPLPDAHVSVRMLRHEYAFGTAVVACRFAGNNCQNDTYQAKLTDLDGEGHGFNEVVFENALKWPGWENHWIASQPQTADAVRWLTERNIAVRGHNLVWPGTSHLPDDINANIENITYVKNRINAHLDNILNYPGIKGNLTDWDVLNEITANRTLEDAFRGKAGYPTGRELYAEIFQAAKNLAPEAEMYINDYVTISQDRSEGEIYDRYQSFIQELIDAGAPLDGIGFQAHIGGFPVSIHTVYQILEDFYQKFGLPSKMTEFDLSPQVNDELAAKYLRDFMTINFSHPSSEGFLMWGFWDGNHWFENAPLFNLDWSLKPAGQAFIDLVFEEWWTETELMTDAQGKAAIRGFKGVYEITYAKDGELQRDTITLSEDRELTLVTGQTTGIEALRVQEDIEIFPNPAKDRLFIRRDRPSRARLSISDLSGKVLSRHRIEEHTTEIPLRLPSGFYTLIWEEGDRLFYQKLVVQ